MTARARALPAVLVVAAGLLAGCAPVDGPPVATAGCGNDTQAYNPTLVVMAQSVPTAALIPCIELVPTGWRHGDLLLSDTGASFVLSSDRDGPRALTVELTASCDTGEAVRVPSEHPDMTRFERLDGLEGGYRGVRHYVYDGGCTTFRFDLEGDRRAQPVTEASLAVGFTTSEAVVASFVAPSGGEVCVRTLAGSG